VVTLTCTLCFTAQCIETHAEQQDLREQQQQRVALYWTQNFYPHLANSSVVLLVVTAEGLKSIRNPRSSDGVKLLLEYSRALQMHDRSELHGGGGGGGGGGERHSTLVLPIFLCGHDHRFGSLSRRSGSMRRHRPSSQRSISMDSDAALRPRASDDGGGDDDDVDAADDAAAADDDDDELDFTQFTSLPGLISGVLGESLQRGAGSSLSPMTSRQASFNRRVVWSRFSDDAPSWAGAGPTTTGSTDDSSGGGGGGAALPAVRSSEAAAAMSVKDVVRGIFELGRTRGALLNVSEAYKVIYTLDRKGGGAMVPTRVVVPEDEDAAARLSALLYRQRIDSVALKPHVLFADKLEHVGGRILPIHSLLVDEALGRGAELCFTEQRLNSCSPQRAVSRREYYPLHEVAGQTRRYTTQFYRLSMLLAVATLCWYVCLCVCVHYTVCLCLCVSVWGDRCWRGA
jgi:hypothetical protein